MAGRRPVLRLRDDVLDPARRYRDGRRVQGRAGRLHPGQRQGARPVGETSATRTGRASRSASRLRSSAGCFGLLIAYAAIRKGTPGWVRSAYGTFSGVAANFGGIPLAFAFIATLGTIGIVTQFINNVFGVNIYQHGFAIWSRRGVELVYLYFQIPLMILVIAPAIDGLRAEWSEASSNLGASRWQYWRHIGMPVLMPSILGAVILLFGNSFAAYATAYSLTSGTGLPLVPILIGNDLTGNVFSNPHEGQALAFGMFVVLGAMMLFYVPLAAARVTVVQMKLRKPRIALSAVVWLLLGAAYFLVPLIATLLFSLRDAQTGKCCSLSAYGVILHDPQFWSTIKVSFRLALETIVVGLLLFVPTIYWVHLKLPRLRPVVGFLALVPFVIPPIIMVVGLLKFYKDTLQAPFWFLGKPDLFLVGAYVILAFPYIYFSLDAGFRSIDVHTLTEASRGLGASLAHDARTRDPAEHQGGRSERLLPHARDRDGRVHDLEPLRLPHLPDVPPVHQRDAGVSCGRSDADELRDHVGGDALDPPGRTARRSARRSAWGSAR